MQGQNSTNISCSKFKIKIPMRELPAGKNSPKLSSRSELKMASQTERFSEHQQLQINGNMELKI